VGGVRGEDWLYFVASVSVRGRRAEALRTAERPRIPDATAGEGRQSAKSAKSAKSANKDINTAFFGKYGEQCCADTPV
jgi:hypothetical protein